MVALASILIAVYDQNKICIILRSHGPTYGTPNWQMLMHMMANLSRSEFVLMGER